MSQGQAALSEEGLMALGFMEAPVPLMVLSDRRILKVNSSTEELFGWVKADLEGQSIRVLYPSNFDFEKTGARWHRWLESQPRYEDERFMKRRDGMIVWMRAKGLTLTPEDPFKLIVWSFERIEDRRSSDALLTTKEREVTHRIVNGLTSKQIANELGISHRTVEVHRASIMRKLGVQNAAELVAKIIVER
jgi:PAS domain S-box-containing protein